MFAASDFAVDQFVMMESQVDLTVPPFQPSPLPPPDNVLTIGVQRGECGDYSNSYYLQQAEDNYKSGQASLGFGPPLRMRVGKCFAEFFGCRPREYGGAWDESLYGPADPLTGHMGDNATTIAATRADSDPNFDQKQLDGSLDCDAPLIVVSTPCDLPCWLSCAPALIQKAYCAVVDYAVQYCTFTQLGTCIAEAETPALAAACLSKLAATCTSSVILQVINVVISWFNLNPFGCAGCSATTPPGCAAPKHSPPCDQSECYTADGCCGPCDPPEPYDRGDPREPALIHSGSVETTPVDGPSSGLPIHPLDTPGFFVSNPHSREATIPVVPVMIAHPECFACSEGEEAEL